MVVCNIDAFKKNKRYFLNLNLSFFRFEDEENNEKQDEVRQTIVQLLSNTMNQPSVNLAQFLLGFDIRQSLARTSLQDPGKIIVFFSSTN